MAIHEPHEETGIAAMGEWMGDLRHAVAASLTDSIRSAAALTTSSIETDVEFKSGKKVKALPADLINGAEPDAEPATILMNLKEGARDHKGVLIAAGATAVTVAAALAARRHIRPKKQEPTPEEVATKIVRGHAEREAVSEANPNSRFVLMRRPLKGHVIDLSQAYYPPVDEPPTAEVIRTSFNNILGGNNFDSLTDTLAQSKGVEEAIDVIENGDMVALIGAHRERIDTLIMLAAFQAAYERHKPGAWARLIERSRIIVGVEMAELALRSYDVNTSAVDAMRRIGGVFTTFPDTDETRQSIEAGLSPELVMLARWNMVTRFWNQATNSKFQVATISPSGRVDTLQDKPDGTGKEFILHPVSSATGKIIRSFNWLPIVMDLSNGARCKVGELITIDKQRDMHRVMADIIAPLCCELDLASGILTRYMPTQKLSILEPNGAVLPASVPSALQA